jgi:hypothetical protein
MKLISPTQKGLITGLSIIALSAVIFAVYKNFDNPVRLVSYALYAAGIFWTLHDFDRNTAAEEKSFKNYFGQGFKCFIVVTLMMVCATYLFFQFNPAFKTQMVEFMRRQWEQNPDFTPGDVAKSVDNYKKMIVPANIMSAVFAYLGIGTLITILATVYYKYIKN